MTNRPPRGYSWAPFQPGNTMTLTHGAYSPRSVDPVAAEVVAAVASDVDWWRRCDQPAVWAWARTEARVQLLTEWLAERGDLDDDGNVRPAADLLTRLEARAESLRSRLGLDPLSRARLGRDVASAYVDLDRLGTDDNVVITSTGDELAPPGTAYGDPLPDDSEPAP